MRTFSVGLVAPEFPPDLGGVETYSVELARALAGLGHRVTVFTVPHAAGEIVLPGIPVLPLLRRRRRFDRALLQAHSFNVWHATNAAYAWLALETENVALSVHGNDFLRPYINLERPDLERHAHLWRLRGWPRTWLARLDQAIGHRRMKRLMAKSLPRVPCTVANSQYTERALLDMYPACQGRTSVGLVGVADPFLRLLPRCPRAEGEARLLTVCRLSEPRKNVDVVLRALATLRAHYRFRYTVIGDGIIRPALESLTHDLGLADVVRFAGHVDQEELQREMQQADLFVLTSSVLPTSHEGFGIVYLEANAAGVPVLAARVGGAVEAVEEGVTGMFVDTPTVAQVQEAIRRFLAHELCFDPQLCHEFAARFNWRSVAEHFTRCYEQIVPLG